MSNELSAQLAPAAIPTTGRAVWLRSAGIVLAGSAFVALCANRALPLYFTPVPLTLGLPVFAQTPPLTFGMAHLFGPTGGYLLAYPIAAALISSLWRPTRRGFASAFWSAAAGNFVILSCGAVWLAALTHASVQSILAFSVLPFLPGDALKIAAASAIAAGYTRLRRPAA